MEYGHLGIHMHCYLFVFYLDVNGEMIVWAYFRHNYFKRDMTGHLYKMKITNSFSKLNYCNLFSDITRRHIFKADTKILKSEQAYNYRCFRLFCQ